MKKVRYTLAALALVALTASATFAGKTTQVAKEKTMDLDCWRNSSDINVTPPDVDQQDECPGNGATCCFKQEGGITVEYNELQ